MRTCPPTSTPAADAVVSRRATSEGPAGARPATIDVERSAGSGVQETPVDCCPGSPSGRPSAPMTIALLSRTTPYAAATPGTARTRVTREPGRVPGAALTGPSGPASAGAPPVRNDTVTSGWLTVKSALNERCSESVKM